jgi:hypothetical protein
VWSIDDGRIPGGGSSSKGRGTKERKKEAARKRNEKGGTNHSKFADTPLPEAAPNRRGKKGRCKEEVAAS